MTPAIKAAQVETKGLDAETKSLLQTLDAQHAAMVAQGASQERIIAALDNMAVSYRRLNAEGVVAWEAQRRFGEATEREAVAAAKAAEANRKNADALLLAGRYAADVTAAMVNVANAATAAEAKKALAFADSANAMLKQVASMREITPMSQILAQASNDMALAQARVKDQLQAEAAAAKAAADAQRLLNQQLKEVTAARDKSIQSMLKAAEANAKVAATAAQVAAQESQLKAIFEQVAAEYRIVASAASESEKIRAAAAAQVLQGQAAQIASGRQLTGVQQIMAGITQQNAMAQNALAANTRNANAAAGNAAVTQGALTSILRTGIVALTGFYSAQMLVITAVREFKQLVSDSISSMFELATATRKLMVDTGMTAEQSSALLGVFKQYGISGDQAASGLGRLGRGLQGVVNAELDGRNGAIEFRDAMRNLGVESTDFNGRARPHIDVLLDIAEAFHKTSDEAIINQASMALLNRNVGYQMAPLLKLGRDELVRMMEAQKEWGNVLNEDTYPAVLKVSMQQKALESQTAGLKLQLAEALIPTISGLITGLSLWESGLKAVNKQQKDLTKNMSDADKAVQREFDDVFTKIGEAADLYTRIYASTLFKEPLTVLGQTLWQSIFGGTERDAVLADMQKKAAEIRKSIEDALHPPGSGENGPLPINEDELRNVQRKMDDFLSDEVEHTQKALDDIKEARAKNADDILEKQRSLSMELQGLTRTELLAQMEDYVNYTQNRVKLIEDLAEKERSLRLEIAKLDDTELKAERDNVEKRLDIWHSYHNEIEKLEESERFRHEDYLASIEKANRSAQDTQNKLDTDFADKQRDYEEQRVKARADSLKKIEDLEKQHNDKIADLQRDLFNLRATGPETADTLHARRMAAEKLLQAMQDKNKEVDEAKKSAAEELAPKIKAIDDEEAKTKKKYEADKALAARKAADDLAEIERNNKQNEEKFENDKRRAKESADYSISNLAREQAERFADYQKAVQLATDQYNHEVDLAKKKADEQLVEMQRVANKRYEDYLYNWNKDVEQTNHEIELNRIAMDDKILKIGQAHDEYMAKQDLEKARFIEDNKVFIAEIEKRKAALLSLPNVNGGDTSDARAAALSALDQAEAADSMARSTATLEGAAKVFKENVEKDGTARDEFNKHMDEAARLQGLNQTDKDKAFMGSVGAMNFYLPYDMSVIPKWFEDFINSMSAKGTGDIGAYGHLGQ